MRAYDKFLNGFLILLIVAIIGTVAFLIYKYYDKLKINDDANNFLNQIDEQISDSDDEYVDEQEAIDEQTGGRVRGISTDALMYKGYAVAGKLEMPTVNLQYPVYAELTNANQIEYTVAIQFGVGLNKVGNTVIVGHNYRSGLFFGSNKKMQIGDSIFITDYETGKRIEYKIYSKYSTEASDTSYFSRDTGGKREVSLVTCQSNNQYRLVILAREI